VDTRKSKLIWLNEIMNDRANNTKTAMSSAVEVVDGCDSHPDGSDADSQHAPVGSKDEPDGVVVTIEAPSLVKEVGDDPSYDENCDDNPIYDVRRGHTTSCPLITEPHNDRYY